MYFSNLNGYSILKKKKKNTFQNRNKIKNFSPLITNESIVECHFDTKFLSAIIGQKIMRSQRIKRIRTEC